MQPKLQTRTWKKLLSIIMISCLIMLPISQTYAEDPLLEDCVKVVVQQKKAIESQKVVIKKQKELIVEQKKYIVKKEVDASFSKLLNTIFGIIMILVLL